MKDNCCLHLKQKDVAVVHPGNSNDHQHLLIRKKQNNQIDYHYYMSRIVRKPAFAYASAKTKAQISFVVTAKLISAFVFAIRIVQFLYFLNPTCQASSHLLWLYSPVCVGPGQKPQKPIFSRGSYLAMCGA